MSRSNYDKPFYVDVCTSIAAIRCASNYDNVFSIDLEISKLSRESIIESCKKMCDRMNREAKIFMEKRNINSAAMRKALEKIVSLTNSLDENCAVDPVEIRDIARNALLESSVG